MRVMRTILGMLAALLIALVGMFAWGRLRPPTTVQAEAMALLKPVSPPAATHNAWPTLWLLDEAIPAGQVDSVYDEERGALEALARRYGVTRPPDWPTAPRVDGRFPKRPALTNSRRDLLCGTDDHDCLAKVRSHLPTLRALMNEQAGRVDALRAVPVDAALWDDMPFPAWVPFPPMAGAGDLWRTAAALEFADGHQVQALTQLCRDARTVRHLHAHTNSLLANVATVGWMAGDEELLAAMLSELPADQPIPADCSEAFAPVSAVDVDMCPAQQREFARSKATMASVDPRHTHGIGKLKRWVLFDQDHTRRLLAPHYAWPCRPEVVQALLDDRTLPEPASNTVRIDLFDAVSNPTGQILARIATGPEGNYMNRNAEYAAGLRAMAWLIAARPTAATPQDWRLRWAADRAAVQRSGRRTFRLDTDARRLVVSYPKRHAGDRELVLRLMP